MFYADRTGLPGESETPPAGSAVPTMRGTRSHGPAGGLWGVERVSDTGVPESDRPEPTLEDVGREFPGWHCYAPGVNGFVYANLPGSFPFVVLRGKTPADLRNQIQRWIGG